MLAVLFPIPDGPFLEFAHKPDGDEIPLLEAQLQCRVSEGVEGVAVVAPILQVTFAD